MSILIDFEKAKARAAQRLQNLTLEQKVGQMFFIGFEDAQTRHPISEMIRERGFGNVILFRRNLKNPRQVAELVNGLQSYAQAGTGVPLLVAVDQEGGKINRIENGVTVMPSALYMGLYCPPEKVHEVGRIAAVELSAMGFNVNFAPVCDVGSNTDNPIIYKMWRSFSRDANEVADLAYAYLQGLQQGGCMGTAKHFPGHGDTSTDSHKGLPKVDVGMDVLINRELVPYKKLIDSGELHMVMSSHVQFTKVVGDEFMPATLSKKIMTDLLRGELGFRGVVVTDDMEMGAIRQNIGTAESAVRAVEAGCDMLIYCCTIGRQLEAHKALVDAVHSGRISESRIDESVLRILTLKEMLNLFETGGMVDPTKVSGRVGTWEHKAFRESLDNLPRKPNHPDSFFNPVSGGK